MVFSSSAPSRSHINAGDHIVTFGFGDGAVRARSSERESPLHLMGSVPSRDQISVASRDERVPEERLTQIPYRSLERSESNASSAFSDPEIASALRTRDIQNVDLFPRLARRLNPEGTDGSVVSAELQRHMRMRGLHPAGRSAEISYVPPAAHHERSQSPEAGSFGGHSSLRIRIPARPQEFAAYSSGRSSAPIAIPTRHEA